MNDHELLQAMLNAESEHDRAERRMYELTDWFMVNIQDQVLFYAARPGASRRRILAAARNLRGARRLRQVLYRIEDGRGGQAALERRLGIEGR